jgi:DNA-binding transcriptional MerR regulator
MDLTHTMTSGDVRKALDVSPTRLRQLDEQLHPQRVGPGKHRRYSVTAVEAYLASKRR